MEKEGKADLLSVVILSILIFAVFAVLVFGEGVKVDSTFPENNTNASTTYGYGPSAKNATFNVTKATFHCNAGTNGSDYINITNVSLYIGFGSPFAYNGDTSRANQTQNTTAANARSNSTFIFNISSPTAFDEGTYWWFCRAEDNGSTVFYNSSLNKTFTIDKSGPGYTNLTNTSNADVATGSIVYISANFTDTYTTIHTVRLFVNHTGSANTEVNTTADVVDVTADNSSMVNLSYIIPGRLLGGVLNFTLWANDSVNNYNITSAILIRVTQDATPPGITLNKPIHLFNQTSPTVSFNFTAYDNNNSQFYNFTCGINISLATSTGPVQIFNISNIQVTNGTDQINTTLSNIPVSLSNGTYVWNVSCIDKTRNLNTSLSQNFTIDQIPPVLINLTINGTGAGPFILGNSAPESVPVSGDGSWAQGRVFEAFANFSDNLTRPVEMDLQYYNAGSGSWVTINTTQDDVIVNISNSAKGANASANLSFKPSTGHTYFEGRNVSFRVVVNDSVGNANNSASAYNVTIMINDTAKPNITITLPIVNGTNQSSATLTVNWSIDEGNSLTEINISVDGVGISDGVDDGGCNKYKRYIRTGSVLVNAKHNGTWSTSSGGTCGLTNGSHYVVVQATDTWGNSIIGNRTFNVQSASTPIFSFSLTFEDATGTWIKSAVNGTNITSRVGVTLFGTNGVGASIDKISYFSSCDSTVRVESNNTVVYPFNASSCNVQSGNRTLTTTINDTAGNNATNVTTFMVDNVAPTITVHSPTSGFSTTGAIDVNVSAFDGESQIEWIKYYLDGGFILLNHSQNGSTLTEGFGQNTSTIFGSVVNKTINFTAGTHTIKISVNDTLGNIRNSSEITFTYAGPIKPDQMNSSLNTYLSNLNPGITFNTSIRLKDSTGTYNEIGSANESGAGQTFQIFLNLNSSSGKDQMNVTITNINGSGANWDKINFSVLINETKVEAGVKNNWTNTLLSFIYFNSSRFDEFLTNTNDYYGFVLMPFNLSGNISTAQEFWWVETEGTLTTRTNISQCTGGFSATTTTPCWNYTSGGKTLVQVPHFSIVLAVNDSTAPTVTINRPVSTQTVSEFVPNITVSSDAVSCKYVMNGTGSSASSNVSSTATASNTLCIWSAINFKNGFYNITYNVTDAAGNINLTSTGNERTFTVSDSTTPNSGTSISASSIGKTTATVTITGVNESVNATVWYSTTNTSFTSSSTQTTFSTSPSVSLIGLTAGTTYYYNVTLSDYNGNSVFNSTVFSFATTAAATTTTTTSSSSGGAGGAVPASTIAASQAQVWSIVPAGTSFSLKVDRATIAITSVAVNNVKTELKNVEIEAAALTENPVSAEAAAKIYQYLRVTKKNIADTDAGSFKISFRVTKAWLTENSLASGDIALYRFKDVWNELAAKVTGTDDTYVNYEAETHGFSSFAIGVKSGVVVEEVPAEVPAEVPTEVPGEEIAPPEAVESKGVEAPSKPPTAWIIAAVVVILGIILIVAYQKKKQQV